MIHSLGCLLPVSHTQNGLGQNKKKYTVISTSTFSAGGNPRGSHERVDGSRSVEHHQRFPIGSAVRPSLYSQPPWPSLLLIPFPPSSLLPSSLSPRVSAAHQPAQLRKDKSLDHSSRPILSSVSLKPIHRSLSSTARILGACGNGVHIGLDDGCGHGGEGDGAEAEARCRGGRVGGCGVQVADAAGARDLLVQAPRGAPPRPRRVVVALPLLRCRRAAQQSRARGGRPRAGRRGARAHVLEPRNPRQPSATSPSCAPRAPPQPRFAPRARPCRSLLLRKLAAGGHRKDTSPSEEGAGTGTTAARLPEAAVPGAPCRGLRLHRRAGDAGSRHDGPRGGALRRVTLFVCRRQRKLVSSGVTPRRQQASRFVHSL
jgi:hypothetical protein